MSPTPCGACIACSKLVWASYRHKARADRTRAGTKLRVLNLDQPLSTLDHPSVGRGVYCVPHSKPSLNLAPSAGFGCCVCGAYEHILGQPMHSKAHARPERKSAPSKITTQAIQSCPICQMQLQKHRLSGQLGHSLAVFPRRDHLGRVARQWHGVRSGVTWPRIAIGIERSGPKAACWAGGVGFNIDIQIARRPPHPLGTDCPGGCGGNEHKAIPSKLIRQQ